MALNRHNDIFEIEAVGPLVILQKYPELLRGCLWLHFVDNAAGIVQSRQWVIIGLSRRCDHWRDVETHTGFGGAPLV